VLEATISDVISFKKRRKTEPTEPRNATTLSGKITYLFDIRDGLGICLPNINICISLKLLEDNLIHFAPQ